MDFWGITLWANDQILLCFPEAKPFVAWMEPPSEENQEPMINVVGDGNGASFFDVFFRTSFP